MQKNIQDLILLGISLKKGLWDRFRPFTIFNAVFENNEESSNFLNLGKKLLKRLMERMVDIAQ